MAYTFESTKTDVKFKTAILTRSNHPSPCPVIQSANLVDRIWRIPGATENTHLYKYRNEYGEEKNIHAHEILSWYQAVVGTIGKARLGFEPEDIGTHSNRSAGTTAMFLAHVLICTIMIVGRWASDAFVKYLRPQVLGFIKNISERMLATEHFTALPDFDPFESRARHFATTGSGIIN